MKISHEVSHAWFGIMIGAVDWTEAWISEGFATFMEEVIHDLALAKLGVKVDTALPALRLGLFCAGLIPLVSFQVLGEI